jgi:hypothetical protein
MPFAFRFRIAFLAVAAHSAGSLLVAQDLASSGASASGCEVAPPTPDSTNVDVFMALGPSTVSGHEWYGDKRVLPPTQHRQLEAVLRSFRSLFPASALIPADLGQPLDVGDLDFVKAASTSAPSLRSRTTFTLHGDGRRLRCADRSVIALTESRHGARQHPCGARRRPRACWPPARHGHAGAVRI